MKPSAETMMQKHHQLVHCELMKVTSHIQRFNGECMLNTLMVDGYDFPFKYYRKYKYRNLKGKRVDLTYYPTIEVIAGFEVDIMKVVHISRSPECDDFHSCGFDTDIDKRVIARTRIAN